MSLTIASLKYQDTDSSLMRHIRNSYSWLQGVKVMDSVAGKATVNDISITGTLLKASDCVLDDNPTALTAKEIELNYYNLSFPISHCDLKRTWLSAFANKYSKEEDVYIDALIPYLAEQMGDEIRAQFHADLIAEATADAGVTKVTLAGTIANAQDSFNTVLEFINGLPSDFLKEALDSYSNEFYGIEVSTEVFKLVSNHMSDKHGSYGIRAGGLSIVANKELSGKEMIAKSYNNDLLVIDDSNDLGKIGVIVKEWENKSYITTGIAFKGSYVDSKRIVISN
tara:strand:+ start:2347 stop:3192 length:846 start_codon:yes stop_codon:yes gene_type:complete